MERSRKFECTAHPKAALAEVANEKGKKWWWLTKWGEILLPQSPQGKGRKTQTTKKQTHISFRNSITTKQGVLERVEEM